MAAITTACLLHALYQRAPFTHVVGLQRCLALWPRDRRVSVQIIARLSALVSYIAVEQDRHETQRKSKAAVQLILPESCRLPTPLASQGSPSSLRWLQTQQKSEAANSFRTQQKVDTTAVERNRRVGLSVREHSMLYEVRSHHPLCSPASKSLHLRPLHCCATEIA
ncbi:uncharacterized protein C8Q71DRAFT_283803 [Rhodofomes roseus]|uniref:Uncharacterized protein n=1 Tax=Rhodofomes roseus TaxID=34475 RepID=A0ABQ8K4E2_9APHY|nr:uncharacterized protein C8Q71DRAFT_283803 [Rhodofomes roseus]KAH9831758.1 hypothetical protein C8Q71DRAFT_283803 [Rhodofomes roseus]